MKKTEFTRFACFSIYLHVLNMYSKSLLATVGVDTAKNGPRKGSRGELGVDTK